MSELDTIYNSRQWISFQNTSGETAPAYAVMAVTGANVDSVTGDVVLTVEKPSTTLRRMYLINGPRDVSSGKYGAGTFDVTMALHDDSATPSYGHAWGPKPNQWTLSIYYPGFIVLGAASTSPSRVLVQWQGIHTLRGKTDGEHTQGSSGDITIWAGAGFSLGEETDYTISALNLFADLEISKWVVITYIEGVAYLTAGECV